MEQGPRRVNNHCKDFNVKRIAFILLSSILFFSCAPADKGGSTQYVFEYKGVPIPVHAELNPILEKIGKANNYFEAPSCAFKGLEKIYTYGNFNIHTYEDKGVDYVGSVSILDDSIATKEGLYLFSPVTKALKIYGEGYTKNMGQYTWTSGDKKSKLVMLEENGKIVSIEYSAILK